MRVVVIFCFVFLMVHPTDAQEAAPEASADGLSAVFTSSRLTPLVGQPITLTMTIEAPSGVTVLELPEFDWVMPFMLLDVGEVVIETLPDGGRSYTQTLDLRLWEPGDHETPETFVRYQVGEEIFSVPVRPVFFTVPSVLESNDLNTLEPRPLKPQISFFYVPPWLAGVGLVLAVAVGWFGRKRYLMWRTHQRERNRVILTPEQIMQDRLASLQLDLVEPQVVYQEVSDILRDYLYARQETLALDLTTAELLQRLNGGEEGDLNILDEVQRADVERILTQADLVKFADYQPSEKAARGMVSFALRLSDSVTSVRQQESEISEPVGDSE